MSSNSICNYTGDKKNRNPAAWSSDFVITRMITDRIGHELVLLPLLTLEKYWRYRKNELQHIWRADYVNDRGRSLFCFVNKCRKNNSNIPRNEKQITGLEREKTRSSRSLLVYTVTQGFCLSQSHSKVP